MITKLHRKLLTTSNKSHLFGGLEEQIRDPCALTPVDRLLVGGRFQILYALRFTGGVTIQQQQPTSRGVAVDPALVLLMMVLLVTIRMLMRILMMRMVMNLMLLLVLLLWVVLLVLFVATTRTAGSARRGRRSRDAQFEGGVYGGLYWGITSKRSGA